MNDHLEQKVNEMRPSYFQIKYGNIGKVERNDSSIWRKINSDSDLNERMHDEEHFGLCKPATVLVNSNNSSRDSLKSKE